MRIFDVLLRNYSVFFRVFCNCNIFEQLCVKKCQITRCEAVAFWRMRENNRETFLHKFLQGLELTKELPIPICNDA